MLKFNTWPPEPGEVVLTDRGQQRVAADKERAATMGSDAADLLMINAGLKTAMEIVSEIGDHYASTANIDAFCEAARLAINMNPDAPFVLTGEQHV